MYVSSRVMMALGSLLEHAPMQDGAVVHGVALGGHSWAIDAALSKASFGHPDRFVDVPGALIGGGATGEALRTELEHILGRGGVPTVHWRPEYADGVRDPGGTSAAKVLHDWSQDHPILFVGSRDDLPRDPFRDEGYGNEDPLSLDPRTAGEQAVRATNELYAAADGDRIAEQAKSEAAAAARRASGPHASQPAAAAPHGKTSALGILLDGGYSPL
jgi:hypothetical protein